MLQQQESKIPDPTVGTCAVLNENVSLRLIYLHTCYQLEVLFGTIWEVCPCWKKYATNGVLWEFEVQPFPVFCPCFVLTLEDVSPQHSTPAAILQVCLPTMVGPPPSAIVNPNKVSFY